MSLDTEQVVTYSQLVKEGYEKNKEEVNKFPNVLDGGPDAINCGIEIVDLVKDSSLGDAIADAASVAGDAVCSVASGAADVAGAAVEVVGSILSGL